MDVHDKIIKIIPKSLNKPYRQTFNNLLQNEAFKREVIDIIDNTIYIDGKIIDNDENLDKLLEQISKLIVTSILEQLVHDGTVELLAGPDGHFRYKWAD